MRPHPIHDPMILVVPPLSPLEVQGHVTVERLGVFDDGGEADLPGTSLGHADLLTAREHGHVDVELGEHGDQLLAPRTALLLEVQTPLPGQQQTLQHRAELTGAARFDHHDAHEVTTRTDALVDVGAQAGHSSTPSGSWANSWPATVAAASTSRLGMACE